MSLPLPSARHRCALRGGVAVLGLMAAGCSGQGSASSATPRTEHVADNRFTVTFSGAALQAAQGAGINLPAVVSRALEHINVLLPGPATTIAVGLAQPGTVIPQTGAFGVTTVTGEPGQVTVSFRSTQQASLRTAVEVSLPRALSHEVDHSVRILAGPGFGTLLLPQIISEGISSVLDEAAFPGPPNPWDRAISPSQECTLWNTAQLDLQGGGLYDAWMFGSPGIPHWTGFTIGYDIVKDYRDRHPQVSWSALTSTSAATILAGSGYRPCAR
ncbi:MAG TPA: DUF2268 domain-containing putative Zn-dependent protease [Streptosporangiaceae bacterium]|nr:DUF2268 domain-containing putative Zn-dependent protease [Streptosporangiaceae bacterium]